MPAFDILHVVHEISLPENDAASNHFVVVFSHPFLQNNVYICVKGSIPCK